MNTLYVCRYPPYNVHVLCSQRVTPQKCSVMPLPVSVLAKLIEGAMHVCVCVCVLCRCLKYMCTRVYARWSKVPQCKLACLPECYMMAQGTCVHMYCTIDKCAIINRV